MKKILTIVIILLLGISGIVSLAGVSASGEPEGAKVIPEDFVIEMVKDGMVKGGLSRQYIDKHFEIAHAVASGGQGDVDTWTEIETKWIFRVNEYSTEYWIHMTREKAGIGYKPTSYRVGELHEITITISEARADNELRKCLPNYEDGEVILKRTGELILFAEGEENGKYYGGYVNLETGKLTCEEIVGEYEKPGTEPNMELKQRNNWFKQFWFEQLINWFRNLFKRPATTACDWRPSRTYYGACEMYLGAYFDGQKCVGVSGCSTYGDVFPFDSIDQCRTTCHMRDAIQ